MPGRTEGAVVRRAAQAATIGFAALIAFQSALAAGAPLGHAAWGGTNAHLTTGQRVASALSVVVYIAAIVVVRRRAHGRVERRYRWGTWALAMIFVVAALANIASDSAWENYLLAPVALALGVLCAVVARTSSRSAARGRPAIGRPHTVARRPQNPHGQATQAGLERPYPR
jgi:hypothetical protein